MISLILNFTEFIVDHHDFIFRYHNPVGTFGQSFSEKDIDFIQHTGRPVIPRMHFRHFQQFFQPDNQRLCFILIDDTGQTIAFDGRGDIFLCPYLTEHLVHQGTVFTAGIIKEKAFAMQTKL